MSKLVKVVKDTRKTEFDKSEELQDYRIVCESREVSLLGRREALTGKAKSGIFRNGSEVPPIGYS